jgi:hypothetical protein
VPLDDITGSPDESNDAADKRDDEAGCSSD